MKTSSVLGLVGFGQMGSVLASRLQAAEYRVRVFDVDPAAQRQAREGGFEVAPSLPAAASGAEILLLCLPDAGAVEEVIAGEAGVTSWQPVPGLCIDLTSSLPGVTRRMGELLSLHGVGMVDAPVSGGVAGARSGTLTVMVGGDEGLVERVRPLLSTFASNVIWSGPLGAGHATKAFNNALSAASFIATAEAIAAAVAIGISAKQTVEAINDGRARSQNSEVKYPRDVLTRQYEAGFRLGLLQKDVAGACVIAQEAGFSLVMAATAREVLTRGMRQLGPAADFTRMYEVLAPDDKTLVRVSGRDARDDLAALDLAVFGILLLASSEVAQLVKTSGLDLARTLSLFNLSSGRNECTRALSTAIAEGAIPRAGATVEQILHATQWVASLGVASKSGLPLTSLAAKLWTLIVGRAGEGADAWSAMDFWTND